MMTSPTRDRGDEGFSLIELLVVIVVLGILASLVVFAVRGIRDDGQEHACSQHRRVVATAIESSYYADQATDALPDVGPTDGEQYERGLVDAEFLREVSVYYDIEPNGTLVPQAGSPCP